MICYRCEADAGKDEYCPVCGADLRLFQRAVRMSNVYYNDGLMKARVRNLSGAITSLQTSLRFYKFNTDARNLLGLIYYEMGEGVDALCEWVISRSFQMSDNRANHYLSLLQKDGSAMDKINQTVRKYNRALEYCANGSIDLAYLQLKKALSINPNMVRARQLMALIYINQGNYPEAKKQLRKAGRVDTNNTLTLRYLHEVNRVLLQKKGGRKSKKNDDLISYQSGNETIIMPKRFRESSLAMSLLYIILGLLLGTMVTVFLVLPEVRTIAVSNVQEKLLAANQTLEASYQSVATLQSDLDELQEAYDSAVEALAIAQEENAEEAGTAAQSYQSLLNAYLATETDNALSAGYDLTQVVVSDLDSSSKDLYNTLYDEVMDSYLSQTYESGHKNYEKQRYEDAISALVLVTDVDMDYGSGEAAYELAESYRLNGDAESASPYYLYLVENYPDSAYAQEGEQYIIDNGDNVDEDVVTDGDE